MIDMMLDDLSSHDLTIHFLESLLFGPFSVIVASTYSGLAEVKPQNLNPTLKDKDFSEKCHNFHGQIQAVHKSRWVLIFFEEKYVISLIFSL